MKFSAVALFAGLAAASQVTISNLNYNRVNGYPMLNFQIDQDDVACAVDHYELLKSYPCSHPDWTFEIREAEGRSIRLNHTVDGKTATGDFSIRLYGPIPTILQQIGTSTAIMEATA